MTRDPNRETIFPLLHETLHRSKAKLEKVYEALLSGKTDKEFWRSLAKKKGVQLTDTWRKDFTAIMRDSFANPKMFALVHRLKQKQLPIILFSNMDAIPALHFREMGLFEPFDRHIFAFEIDAAKADPKAYQILLQEV
jgi:FMN phosphatase YigB (HAD superfamily)